MTSSLDYGRKILMKRMIHTLEQEGYRVEFAEDYHGWIVAGQGEDPAVMLLDADAIERFRMDSPGNAKGFLEGIVTHVQGQISAQGSQSLQPPAGEAALEYADVPSEPPTAVTGEVADDMIMDEEPADVEDLGEEMIPEAEADPSGDEVEDAPLEAEDDAVDDEVSVNMDEFTDLSAEETPAEEDAAEEPPEADEKEKIESESTEELSLEDFGE